MHIINYEKSLLILLLLINVINSDDEITFYDQFNRSIPIDTINKMTPYHITNDYNENHNSNISSSNNISGLFNTINNYQLSPLPLLLPTNSTSIIMKTINVPIKEKIITTKSNDQIKLGEHLKNTDNDNNPSYSSLSEQRSKLLNFNLDDLENVHHESFNRRNDDFNDEEMHLLEDRTSTLKQKSVKKHFLPTPLPSSLLTSSLSSSSPSSALNDNGSIEQIHVVDNKDVITTSQKTNDHANIKNVKNQKLKVKVHDIMVLQKDEISKGHSSVANLYNSVNHFYVDSVPFNSYEYSDNLSNVNNNFRILVNLFDHFNWNLSDIRTKLSTVCGIEIFSYLSALNNNIEWAQKAYDSSGRYRGQILYGNDLWLGQRLFCDEINYNNKKLNRKHFKFGFYIARTQIHLPMENTNLSKILQIGECLPASCTLQDIEIILNHDLQSQILLSQQNTTHITTSNNDIVDNNKFQMKILSIRNIPGSYFIWNDQLFQILCGVFTTLLCIIFIATIYEFRLPQQQQQLDIEQNVQTHIENENKTTSIHSSLMMNTKFKKIKKSLSNTINDDDNDDENKSIKSNKKYNEKITVLELCQITNLNDNNNVQDLDNNQHNHHLNGNSKNHSISTTMTIPNNNVTNSNALIRKNLSQESLQKKNDNENSCNSEKFSRYQKNEIGLLQKILLCFALGSNGETILSVDRNNEEIISCVHGIRVLSLLWTIMVHTYLQVFTIGENRFRRNITERTFWYQIIGNATFSVDSFFFISGLLVCLLFQRSHRSTSTPTNTTKEFVKKGSYKTIIMILYRYIRLSPAYLFVIGFNLVSLRYIFNNSVFQPTIADHLTCSKYWWRNILYVNNFYPFKELCMIWSWYLANDTQFYIMAIILLITSKRYFKVSLIILLTFLITSWGTSGLFSLYFNYTHKVAEPFESFDFLYDKPWQRIGTYIIGMITGYIIHNVQKPPKIPFILNLLLWIFSIGILFSLIFGVWEGQLSVISTAFYVSIGHTAWGIGLIWITLSCSWGYSNTINKILSYRGFLPLSRLTYCTYLIHPVIMLITSFQMEGPIHLEHPIILTMFMGNAILSFIIAFVISVMFEAPVIRLLKIFFRK